MTLVTISASYGCGGSRIAPALAERLGVPLLGRPPAPDLDPEVEEPSGRLLSRVASLEPPSRTKLNGDPAERPAGFQ